MKYQPGSASAESLLQGRKQGVKGHRVREGSRDPGRLGDLEQPLSESSNPDESLKVKVSILPNFMSNRAKEAGKGGFPV